MDKKDITFVVQGPVIKQDGKNLTAICTKSIRRFFPESQILFSTWKETDTKDIAYDAVIFNKDPGSIDTPNRMLTNINRQIVSTRNGLRRVKTAYAIKIRSDTELLADDFLQTFEKAREKSPLFKEKVVTPLPQNPKRTKSVFFVGDVFMFGRTEDLRTIWSPPLLSSAREKTFRSLSSEEFIWRSVAERLKVKISGDLKQDIPLFEQFIAKNLVPLTTDELGIKLLKYPRHNLYQKLSYYDYTSGELKHLLGKRRSFIEWINPYRFIKFLHRILMKARKLSKH